MANEEHLAIFKQGVKAWDEWREENPETRFTHRVGLLAADQPVQRSAA